MAFRILACLILLAFATQATEEPSWTWYPMNSEQIARGKVVAHHSGLAFYFTGAPAPSFSITAIVVDCGKERTVSGDIDADGSHGGAFLRFPITSLDGFRVKRLTVVSSRSGITLENPRAGVRQPYMPE